MKKLLIIIAIVVSSCGMNDNSMVSMKILIDEDLEREVKLSEIFCDFDIIKLETNENSMLSNIWKIEKDSGRVFCFDESLGKVFIFDSDGGFIGTTANKGKGPGETISCNDFSIDRCHNVLETLDNMTKKILSYDYDGHLIELKQGIPRSGFEIMNTEEYLGYSYNNFVEIEPKIISFNMNGKHLKNFDNISERNLQRNTYSNLEKSSTGEIFLIPVYEFNLYQFVDPFSCIHIAEFWFSKQIPTQKYEIGLDQEVKDAIKNDGAPYLIKDLHIVNRTIYFKYLFGKESGHYFWNMDNNHQEIFRNDQLVNDIIPNLPLSIRGISEDGLLCVISASSLIKLIQEDSQDGSLTRILEEKSIDIKHVNEQDNPIIINFIYREEF